MKLILIEGLHGDVTYRVINVPAAIALYRLNSKFLIIPLNKSIGEKLDELQVETVESQMG